MEALEFFRERKRMCDSYMDCESCPLVATECVVKDMTSEDTCKRIVAAVEQWSKEHPRKTRQSVLLEQWPNCMISEDGVVGMCPRNFDKMYVCNLSSPVKCRGCRREFWMQEV